MTHSVVIYDYETKANKIIHTDYYYNCLHYMESFIYDYITERQGSNKIIYKDCISMKDWDNNIRLWVSKSKNPDKYTIKQMVKSIGLLYNSKSIIKLCNIRIVKNQYDDIIDICDMKEMLKYQPTQDSYYNFDDVLILIGKKKCDNE